MNKTIDIESAAGYCVDIIQHDDQIKLRKSFEDFEDAIDFYTKMDKIAGPFTEVLLCVTVLTDEKKFVKTVVAGKVTE